MRSLQVKNPTPVYSRRTFLGRSVGMTLVSMLSGCEAGTVQASKGTTATMLVPPSRSRGSARISVRDTGARGDGASDDTAAFQRAINALPPDGGTVEVPGGTYLIDAVKSVRLRSRMHLQLAPDATLVARPNNQERAYVLYVYRVQDAEISGGKIIGERKGHRGTEGEWGHGIQIRGGSRVTVRDMHISGCWGDGICMGAAKVKAQPRILSTDVVIAGIVSTGNRRQGLSIGGSRDVQVYDSEFSDTSGTSPQCGIDVEPDRPDITTNVQIRNCLIRGNAAYGVLAYERTRNVTIEDCIIEDNRSCGVVTVGCTGAHIVGNTIRNNGSTGLFIKRGSNDIQVSRNTFFNNYTRQGWRPREGFSMVGLNRSIKRDILIGESVSDIEVGRNQFR